MNKKELRSWERQKNKFIESYRRDLSDALRDVGRNGGKKVDKILDEKKFHDKLQKFLNKSIGQKALDHNGGQLINELMNELNQRPTNAALKKGYKEFTPEQKKQYYDAVVKTLDGMQFVTKAYTKQNLNAVVDQTQDLEALQKQQSQVEKLIGANLAARQKPYITQQETDLLNQQLDQIRPVAQDLKQQVEQAEQEAQKIKPEVDKINEQLLELGDQLSKNYQAQASSKTTDEQLNQLAKKGEQLEFQKNMLILERDYIQHRNNPKSETLNHVLSKLPDLDSKRTNLLNERTKLDDQLADLELLVTDLDMDIEFDTELTITARAEKIQKREELQQQISELKAPRDIIQAQLDIYRPLFERIDSVLAERSLQELSELIEPLAQKVELAKKNEPPQKSDQELQIEKQQECVERFKNVKQQFMKFSELAQKELPDYADEDKRVLVIYADDNQTKIDLLYEINRDVLPKLEEIQQLLDKPTKGNLSHAEMLIGDWEKVIEKANNNSNVSKLQNQAKQDSGKAKRGPPWGRRAAKEMNGEKRAEIDQAKQQDVDQSSSMQNTK